MDRISINLWGYTARGVNLGFVGVTAREGNLVELMAEFMV